MEENHVKELVMVKSVNCASCGAGLSNTVGKCKCGYCGNVNLILDNGQTKIFIDVKSKPKTITTSKSESFFGLSNMWKPIVMFLAVVCVAGFCLFAYRYMKTKKI